MAAAAASRLECDAGGTQERGSVAAEDGPSMWWARRRVAVGGAVDLEQVHVAAPVGHDREVAHCFLLLVCNAVA